MCVCVLLILSHIIHLKEHFKQNNEKNIEKKGGWKEINERKAKEYQVERRVGERKEQEERKREKKEKKMVVTVIGDANSG